MKHRGVMSLNRKRKTNAKDVNIRNAVKKNEAKHDRSEKKE